MKELGMRFLLIFILLASPIQSMVSFNFSHFDLYYVLQEEFKDEKLTLGKKKCKCSFQLEAGGSKCTGKVTCDRKCSGSGTVQLGMFSFTLKMK